MSREGRASADMLCSVIGLPKPPSRFQTYNKILLNKTGEVAEEVLKVAAHEAISENKSGRQGHVSRYRRKLAKRCHISLNGIFTVTGLNA